MHCKYTLLYTTYFYKLPNPKLIFLEILSHLDMFRKSGTQKYRYSAHIISKGILKVQCETNFSLFMYYVSVCCSK